MTSEPVAGAGGSAAGASVLADRAVAVSAQPVAARAPLRGRISDWFLYDDPEHRFVARREGPHIHPRSGHKRHSWWRVMCLTGLDYFSTLGYQPGIAVLAAGALSPLATLVLVVLTVFGALPIYRAVAARSPDGQGSIAMLARLLPRWQGKLFVLVLLGFAMTDYLITITLSAADATAHIEENPFAAPFVQGRPVLLTCALIAVLAVVFLNGFNEAIGVAVLLVGVYLVLNVVVIGAALMHIAADPSLVSDWQRQLVRSNPDPLLAVGVVLLVFPRLALGMSGFETGVAVMPLVAGGPGDTAAAPVGRVRGTRRMLTCAALIMSVLLILSSFVTVVLIPTEALESGGPANGRALAYLAHEYLGDIVGTGYDASTIAILWFAGASAMAGLLNLVPRYLPKYGMAPRWARSARPLVVVFTGLACFVTIRFRADVDAQGGAYATGVLALMTSAAVAVTLSMRSRGRHRAAIGFTVLTVVFAYTTVANIVERPDGLRIALLFIVAIVVVSIVSRAVRAFELRVTGVTLDPVAEEIVRTSATPLRLIVNKPGSTPQEYREKELRQRADLGIPLRCQVAFLEVTIVDPSEFEGALRVVGRRDDCYDVLDVRSPSVPNAIAAVLLHLRDVTGERPHAYLEWTEGNPVVHFIRYLVLGDGETAPVTREILREAEHDPQRRPAIHVC